MSEERNQRKWVKVYDEPADRSLQFWNFLEVLVVILMFVFMAAVAEKQKALETRVRVLEMEQERVRALEMEQERVGVGVGIWERMIPMADGSLAPATRQSVKDRRP